MYENSSSFGLISWCFTLGCLACSLYKSLIFFRRQYKRFVRPSPTLPYIFPSQTDTSGLENLIDLSTSSHSNFYFCSSIASVTSSDRIIELPSKNPSDASPIGYSQSKWIAEQICLKANQSSSSSIIKILRIGQLCGDTKTGKWNEKEGWPLMFKTAQTTGVLPDLSEVSLSSNCLLYHQVR